jgi:putative hydrolase of HD superfamily
MELKIQQITLPAFLWYVLPGLNFLLAAVVLPAILIDPSSIFGNSSLGDIAIALLIALVAGFVMDSLKLYKFETHHRTKKSNFLSDIAKQLGAEWEQMEPVLEALRTALPARDAFGRVVAFSHSRWVMLRHSAISFYAFAAIWLVVTILASLQRIDVWILKELGVSFWWGIFVNALIIVTGAATGQRLSKHAMNERELSNRLYIAYVRRHREALRREMLGAKSVNTTRALPAVISGLSRAANLKMTKRAGWTHSGLPESKTESVSDHTYMVCLMAYVLAPNEVVDRVHALQLAMVHDLPEAIVGDMVPDEVTPLEKQRREREAITLLAEELSDSSIAELWEEFERGESGEERFVRELDKLEMALQAGIYEQQFDNIDLNVFVERARQSVTSDWGKSLMVAINNVRSRARSQRTERRPGGD